MRVHPRDPSRLALRLFLLAAQIASECGSCFEDLTYDLYVRLFGVRRLDLGEPGAARGDHVDHWNIARGEGV